MRALSAAALAAGLGFAGLASAQAAPFINGSVVLSDSVTNTGTTTFIVSGLNTFDFGTPAVGTSTGNLAGATTPAAANPLTLVPPGGSYSVTVGGDTFTFTVTGDSGITTTPLACSGGLCGDAKDATLTGHVSDSAGNFASTAFLAQWGATGSCVGALGTCASQVVGSWSITLTATGSNPPPVPEPASLILLGTGLLGLGMVVRRGA